MPREDSMVEQIYLRQTALFHPEDHQARINIVGAGATGSFTALALAKLGLKDIHIWDGDSVEIHNVPNQLHKWDDIGKSKVEATRNIIQMFCQGLDEIEPNVVAHEKFFEETDSIGHGVMVCAADSMEARELLWKKVKNNIKIQIYIDPRIGGQKFHLYCIEPCNPTHQKIYESTLHSDEEGMEIACGERATCDMSFLVASRVVRAIRRFLCSKIVEPFTAEDAIILETTLVAPRED